MADARRRVRSAQTLGSHQEWGNCVKIVDIREASIALEGNISNSVISFADHDVSLVAVVTDVMRNGRPVVGFGFNSIGRFAQAGILQSRIIPRMLDAPIDSLLGEGGFDCEQVYRAAMRNEKPGGHGDRASAIAALELAFWDLNAKLRDEPAYATIARHFGTTPLDRVSAYAAGGYYYPTGGVDRLRDELKRYVDLGFNAFKIKIGGASLSEDMKRIEVALQECGASNRLAVDANGRFDLEQAQEFGRAIAALDLRWYEEVGDPLDYGLNREIAETYSGALATGENLFSTQDVRNLLAFGGMRPGKDVFQMDAGLSYGLGEYARMIAMLEASGFDRKQALPHGGHLINLHIVAGLGLGGCEAYPSVFQPFGGYSPDCKFSDGWVSLPETPGFGLEAKPELRPFLDRLAKCVESA